MQKEARGYRFVQTNSKGQGVTRSYKEKISKKKKKTDTNSQDKFSGIHGTSRVEDLSTNVWGFNSSRDLFISIVVCLC